MKRAAHRLWAGCRSPWEWAWERADEGRRQRWQGQEGEATTAPNAIAAAALAAGVKYGIGGEFTFPKV